MIAYVEKAATCSSRIATTYLILRGNYTLNFKSLKAEIICNIKEGV